MIITVTLNPAIDKTLETDRLVSGGLNRIRNVHSDAGGKGINVSKTIRELGGESIATGFLGGESGKIISSALNKRGISNDFIWVGNETRTNTKVVEDDGTVTEFNEPGPVIAEEQIEQLLCKLSEWAGKNTLVVLSGSAPRGMDTYIYARIIRLLHERGAKVLLDADGELFSKSFSSRPDMMKPNRMELEQFAQYGHHASMEELLCSSREFRDAGTETVLISMGAEGALFARGAYEAFAPALPVQICSTVGAGDAMAAALAFAWEKKFGAEETFRLCMAVSAGAVMTNGTKPPDRGTVDRLMEKVSISRI
ncbi:1-phosphofructokinase [bacterium C-53]|nr:1-phosphofructokinase [Lachnospiraceae bacterium]NBI03545.1 1-phosphofructokinase [Lachnospiraceae bacterium]RKJ09544.1 1-phosphofructokinase [bacterium C-53]